MNIFKFPFLLLLILAVGCQHEKKDTNKVMLKNDFKEKIELEKQQLNELTHAACLYCHPMKIEEGVNELAPSMDAVIAVYKGQYPKKEDFIAAVSNFTIHPSVDKSIMQSAIDQYGLMPDSGIVETDVKEIADYLFDYKF